MGLVLSFFVPSHQLKTIGRQRLSHHPTNQSINRSPRSPKDALLSYSVSKKTQKVIYYQHLSISWTQDKKKNFSKLEGKERFEAQRIRKATTNLHKTTALLLKKIISTTKNQPLTRKAIFQIGNVPINS